MTKESFSIHGENLLKKVKELIEEGNVRKITITDKSGKELGIFPVNSWCSRRFSIAYAGCSRCYCCTDH